MKLHLPKTLFTAVMALFAVPQTVWAADSTYDLLGEGGFVANGGSISDGIYSAEGWATKTATYTTADGYYFSAEDAPLTFSFAYVASNIPDKAVDGVTYADCDAVLDFAFRVSDNLVVLIGSDNFRLTPSTIGYGTTTNTDATSYIGDYNLTSFTLVDGTTETPVTRQENVTYTITGTVSYDKAEDNYTLNLDWKDSKWTEETKDNYKSASISLGSTFELDQIIITSDGGSRSVTSFTIDGALVAYPVYDASISGQIQAADAVWSSSSGDVVAYDSIAMTAGSATLKLTTSGENAEITFADGTNVAGIDVGGNLTIKGDGSLQVGTLSVETGVKATLGSDMRVGAVTGDGTLSIQSDATLSLDSSSTDLMATLKRTEGSGTINISGGGEAFLEGEAIHNGTGQTLKTDPTINATSDFSGVISMANDTKLVIGLESTGGYYHYGQAVSLENATVAINGGGLRFNGHYSTIGTLDVNAADTFHIQDTYSAEGPGLTVKTLNLDADLTLTSTWKATLDIEKLQGTGDLSIGANEQSKAWNVNIASISSSGNISIAGSSTVVTLGEAGANSILNIGGTITNGSTLILADAGVTLNVADITDFAGTIIYDETAALWDVAANAASTTGNGFATKSGYMQVISNTGTLKVGDAAVTDLSSIKVTYNGAEATLTEDGRLHGTSTAVSGDYIVGGTGANATASLTDIVNLATTTNTALDSIVLRNGNTLSIDTAPSAGIRVDAGETGTSTLDIAANQTLSSADVTLTSGSMKFTGSGTYTMLGGLKGEADSAWTGTVYLEAKDNGSGGGALRSVTDLDLAKYGNENSKIVIKGVMGYLAEKMGEVKADIEIQNSSPNGSWAGLDLSDAYEANYTFSGDFSGSGNFVVRKDITMANNPTRGMGFTFKGDMSAFTGQLNNNAGYNVYTFSDNATAVNANVRVTGGTMVLNTDNTSDTTIKSIEVLADKTLKLENKGTGTMKVSKLNDGTNASISVTATGGNVEIIGYDWSNNQNVVGAGSNTTIANIDVAADKNVKVTGNLTVTDTLTVNSANALTVLDGSLSLSDGITFNLTGLNIEEGKTSYTLATAANGVTLQNYTLTGLDLTGTMYEGYKMIIDAVDPNAADGTAPVAEGGNTKTALVLMLEQNTTPLTEVKVTGGSWDATSKVLTLTTDKTAAELAGGFGEKLNAVIADSLWEQLTGEVGTLVDVSFTTADGTTVFDFDGEDGSAQAPTVTLNGIGTNGAQTLTQDGAVVGSYVTAYIPEPTSTTLSILALAALAVRRRRR